MVRLLIVLIPLCFLVVGCEQEDLSYATDREQNEMAWYQCIDTGGVPIKSAWSEQLADCIFNNNK